MSVKRHAMLAKRAPTGVQRSARGVPWLRLRAFQPSVPTNDYRQQPLRWAWDHTGMSLRAIVKRDVPNGTGELARDANPD
jgi:hypothetical protein